MKLTIKVVQNGFIIKKHFLDGQPVQFVEKDGVNMLGKVAELMLNRQIALIEFAGKEKDGEDGTPE